MALSLSRNLLDRPVSGSVRTPWGTAQHTKVLADGVTFYGCAGHGGYKLSRERNARVHKAWRIVGGW